jgi:hypothetical protein
MRRRPPAAPSSDPRSLARRRRRRRRPRSSVYTPRADVPRASISPQIVSVLPRRPQPPPPPLLASGRSAPRKARLPSPNRTGTSRWSSSLRPTHKVGGGPAAPPSAPRRTMGRSRAASRGLAVIAGLLALAVAVALGAFAPLSLLRPRAFPPRGPARAAPRNTPPPPREARPCKTSPVRWPVRIQPGGARARGSAAQRESRGSVVSSGPLPRARTSLARLLTTPPSPPTPHRTQQATTAPHRPCPRPAAPGTRCSSATTSSSRRTSR